MNQIPVITDPKGRYWDQPSRDNILVDDDVAMMSQSDFDKLAEYSTTIPSGTYEGKIWKLRTRKIVRWFLRSSVYDTWYLRWYQDSDDPNMLAIPFRLIEIIEEPIR